MKYEIVQHKNGKFAIRRRNFFQNLFNYGGDFYNLVDNGKHFWKSYEYFFEDCLTDNIKFVLEKHSQLTSNKIKL